jgi:hypothetical protein
VAGPALAGSIRLIGEGQYRIYGFRAFIRHMFAYGTALLSLKFVCDMPQ